MGEVDLGRTPGRSHSPWKHSPLAFPPSFCPNLSAISTTLKLSHNVAVSFWSSSGTLEGGLEGVRGWETGLGQPEHLP